MTETTKFNARNFGLAEFKRNVWHLTLEEFETFDNALSGPSWSNLVAQIIGHDKSRGPGDRVEVWKPDTGAFGEMIINDVGAGYVHANFLRAYEPKVPVIPDDVPFSTQWNRSIMKHEVIRKADKQVMAGGFRTIEKAIEWITDHMAKTRAAA